jgi:hypothetical protein
MLASRPTLAHRTPRRFLTALGLLTVAGLTAAAAPMMGVVETKHFVLHTDLDADGAREATLRMDSMVDEYVERTRGFRGKINKRLPFYLFTKPEEYYAAGGMKGSDGVFMGDKLMAIAGPELRAGEWHVVQHEGFHQFVDAVIKGDIPIWVNEGLAEYFAEAVYTGDGYISGLIPPDRLVRIKKQIADGRFKSVADMMMLKVEDWNSALSLANYDQAWSMIQFLAHAEGGKYQEPITAFAREVGRGLQWQQAWVKFFGRDAAAFEQRWRAYWTSLPDDPTADLYAKATITTLTHFLARAASQDQFFDSPDAFFKAAESGQLKAHKQDWLPPSLLRSALGRVEDSGTWSLEAKRQASILTCTTPAGSTFTGKFKLRSDRVGPVTVTEKAASSDARPKAGGSPK